MIQAGRRPRIGTRARARRRRSGRRRRPGWRSVGTAGTDARLGQAGRGVAARRGRRGSGRRHRLCRPDDPDHRLHHRPGDPGHHRLRREPRPDHGVPRHAVHERERDLPAAQRRRARLQRAVGGDLLHLHVDEHEGLTGPAHPRPDDGQRDRRLGPVVQRRARPVRHHVRPGLRRVAGVDGHPRDPRAAALVRGPRVVDLPDLHRRERPEAPGLPRPLRPLGRHQAGGRRPPDPRSTPNDRGRACRARPHRFRARRAAPYSRP